jgi:hypothetical protein
VPAPTALRIDPEVQPQCGTPARVSLQLAPLAGITREGFTPTGRGRAGCCARQSAWEGMAPRSLRSQSQFPLPYGSRALQLDGTALQGSTSGSRRESGVWCRSHRATPYKDCALRAWPAADLIEWEYIPETRCHVPDCKDSRHESDRYLRQRKVAGDGSQSLARAWKQVTDHMEYREVIVFPFGRS